MKRIYLASPFFNEIEIMYVEKVEKILAEKGLEVFSPMRNQRPDLQAGTRQWSVEIFRNDVKFIEWAEAVVVLYHGNYSDSGTAWEAGYAYGTNKPVIVVHIANESNLMVHEGGHANITLNDLVKYDFDKLPSSFYEGKMF